jgi:hypothetical protein
MKFEDGPLKDKDLRERMEEIEEGRNTLLRLPDTLRLELLSRQVLAAVGNYITQVRVEAYDLLMSERISRYLSDWNIKPTPDAILINKTLDDICQHKIVAGDKEDPKYGMSTWSHGGPPYRAGSGHIEMMRKGYTEAREKLLSLLKSQHLTIEDFTRVPNKLNAGDGK